MAEKNPLQELDDHYGTVGFRLVDDDDEDDGPGMSGKEARTFLRNLRPVLRVRQSLASAAKAVTRKG